MDELKKELEAKRAKRDSVRDALAAACGDAARHGRQAGGGEPPRRAAVARPAGLNTGGGREEKGEEGVMEGGSDKDWGLG